MLKPNKHHAAIRKIALSYPDSAEGNSCNKLSFKSGKKAFLYLGEKEDGSITTMVKLTDSFEEARKLAKKSPKVHRPGSNGWVSSEFPSAKAPPAGLLERWIDESFRALVPKKIVALLDGGDDPKATKKAAKKKATAKKKVANKKSAKKTAKRKSAAKKR